MGLDLIDKILYINLFFRTERNLQVLDQLDKIKADKNKIVRIEGVYSPLNGHLGCALSHIKALDYAIENKLKNVLILEDDAIFQFNRNYIDKHIKYFFDKVKSWDVFFLGGRIMNKEDTDHKNIFRVIHSSCAHAYIVNAHYYEQLKISYLATLKMLEKVVFFTDAEGLALDNLWHVLQLEHKWYIKRPIIVQQAKDYSDTGNFISEKFHKV